MCKAAFFLPEIIFREHICGDMTKGTLLALQTQKIMKEYQAA